ncbi:MAG: hypothetical protein KGM97_07510 [Alphaproteobacteria bacterium]|nr:hypothetical protein [Alphaproteobacteria bacterium]MDE2630821.1 hypothetical protein [Alphaproteobacteria bacterium]
MEDFVQHISRLLGWQNNAAIATTLGAYLGISVSYWYFILVRRSPAFRRLLGLPPREKKGISSLEDRISEALRAVGQATTLLKQLEQEIQDRTSTANKLKAEVEKYKEIKSLTKEQLDAVTAALEGQFSRHGRRAFITNVALTLGSLIAGGLIAHFTPLLFR